MTSTRIAVQMYTLRAEAEKDFLGTLRRIASLGFDGVELAGWRALPARVLRAELDTLGLAAAACHVPLEDLEHRLQEVLDFCRAVGCADVVCPWAEYGGEEDFRLRAARFAEIGRTCAAAGMSFSYHNHAHEFAALPSGYGLDLLFELTDPTEMLAELDIYWIAAAGLDPIDYVAKYAGRSRLLHLKDRAPAADPPFAVLGEGTLDLQPILRCAVGAGIRWLVVEQDSCPRDPFECVASSLRYLKSGNTWR